LESISAIFRIANFKITNVLSKTGLETQRAGLQRRNVMISHSAVETPEQKKFFTPARVRKHVPFTQQLFGCPEAEAVEVTQLNYQVLGLPAGSKERNDAAPQSSAGRQDLCARRWWHLHSTGQEVVSAQIRAEIRAKDAINRFQRFSKRLQTR
jgi:hypothetical protein